MAAPAADTVTVVIAAMIVTASPMTIMAMVDTTDTTTDTRTTTMEVTIADMVAAEAEMKEEGGPMMPMAEGAAAPTGTASTCTVKLSNFSRRDRQCIAYIR